MKAPPAQETIAGDGTGDNASGSTPRREATRDRESEKIDSDTRKEISRLIAPAAQNRFRGNDREPRRRAVAKARGERKAARRDDGNRTDREAAGNPLRRQRQRRLFALPPLARQATVLGHATAAQAAQMIEITQAQMDMPISGRYVANARVFVHIDGTPDGAWGAALLPAGLSAQTGDRVEYTPTACSTPRRPVITFRL